MRARPAVTMRRSCAVATEVTRVLVPLRVAIGSDEAGFTYKEILRADLEADSRVAAVVDVGIRAGEATRYPRVAFAAARLVAAGDVDRAILICGTGLGMAIAANKVRGVRAATAHDSYSVERSVLSNDAHVLCLGQRVIGLEVARRLAREWLGYRFDPSSHSEANVEEIRAFERDEPASRQTRPPG